MCTTDFHPGRSGALDHLYTAAQGFVPIVGAAPPLSEDHRSVVCFAPGMLLVPFQGLMIQQSGPTDCNGMPCYTEYTMRESLFFLSDTKAY